MRASLSHAWLLSWKARFMMWGKFLRPKKEILQGCWKFLKNKKKIIGAIQS